MLSVTSPPPSCASPLKDRVRLLVALPLSGLVIVTFGATAIALPTGPTASATSRNAAARKSPLAALLIRSTSEPWRTLLPPGSVGHPGSAALIGRSQTSLHGPRR